LRWVPSKSWSSGRRGITKVKSKEILTVKWCVVSCTSALRKLKLFQFKFQLLNTQGSSCKMTLLTYLLHGAESFWEAN
jgi:hypothetical protein